MKSYINLLSGVLWNLLIFYLTLWITTIPLLFVHEFNGIIIFRMLHYNLAILAPILLSVLGVICLVDIAIYHTGKKHWLAIESYITVTAMSLYFFWYYSELYTYAAENTAIFLLLSSWLVESALFSILFLWSQKKKYISKHKHHD